MAKSFLTPITVPAGATGSQVPQKSEIDTLLAAKQTIANTYQVTAGKATNIAADTNLQTWADSLPASGIYDISVSVAQGSLPAGWWYIEFIRHASDGVGNLYHTLTATSLTGASGIKYSNTRTNASWGGWVQMATAGSGGGVTISDTAPVAPNAGDLWWDSTSGTLYLFFNDGTSSQWVEATVAKAGAAGTNGTNGTTYTTASNVQLNSLGIGTPASATAGEIRATNNVTAYYSSDERLKENITPIQDPLEKLNGIRGVTFDWTDKEIEKRGGIDGYFVRKSDIGVIAQEIEAVIPEAVATREDGYKAVRYELIVPLLIEALKEQQKQINNMKCRLGINDD